MTVLNLYDSPNGAKVKTLAALYRGASYLDAFGGKTVWCGL